MLKVNNLNLYYGSINALKNISFKVEQGQIVTLIGANGAGKSSILNSLSNLVSGKTGEISFMGKNITNLKPHKIVDMGLVHCPEGRRVFSSMSVYENLELGAFTRKDENNIKKDMDRVFDRFPRLKERRKQPAGTLSGGEQQMLAIGRALMSKPKLLMLDEPSMGLAPLLVKEIFNIIKTVKEEGMTILLVEQNANMALSIADYTYILETGTIISEGQSKEMLNNDKVRKAYLGS